MPQTILPITDTQTRQASCDAFRIVWKNVSVVVCGVAPAMVAKLATCLALGGPQPATGEPCDVSVTHAQGKFRITYRTQHHDVASQTDVFMMLATLVPANLMEKAGVTRRMHAAGIRVGDRVVLISGEGHMGKSSISLMAWRRGYQILGDDWLLFSDDFTGMAPIPKPLKARMTAAQFTEFKATTDAGQAVFGNVISETRVLIARDAGFYNDWDRPLPVGALVFLDRDGTDAACMDQMPVKEALPLLLSQTILCKNSKTLAGVAFARALNDRGVPVYRLNLGGSSPDAALDAILAEVEG